MLLLASVSSLDDEFYYTTDKDADYSTDKEDTRVVVPTNPPCTLRCHQHGMIFSYVAPPLSPIPGQLAITNVEFLPIDNSDCVQYPKVGCSINRNFTRKWELRRFQDVDDNGHNDNRSWDSVGEFIPYFNVSMDLDVD